MAQDRGIFSRGLSGAGEPGAAAGAGSGSDGADSLERFSPIDSQPRRWRDLHRCVAMLLETNCGIRVSAEKRTHRRFPFRKPLTVTPISEKSGRPEPNKSFAAFGIDISSIGIGFLTRQLVPTPRAVLICSAGEHAYVNLLFEPRWVRFTRGGWYQIGGRLVSVLEETVAPVPDLRLAYPPDADLS